MADKRTERIKRAFGAAAEGYEDSAGVQAIVAETVAKLAAQRRVPAQARILEIGCGTGLLTRHIRAQWPEAELAVFDYLEGWYNPRRRHSALDYLSPVAYEKRKLVRG